VSFVLDNSVAMRWYFGDGKPQELAYASRVLEAMKSDEAVVPAIWSLEVANVLARAEAKELGTEARSEAFRRHAAADGHRHRQRHLCAGARAARCSWRAASSCQRTMRRILNWPCAKGLPLATLDDDLTKAAKRAGVKRFDAK
jgi:predicted nucleic acid-binding protein